MAETFTVEIDGAEYVTTGSIVGEIYRGGLAASAIQTAINNADDGDTININAGTYPVNSQIVGGGLVGVSINGVGVPILDFTAQASSSVLITFYGSVGAALTPNADLNHGEFSVTTTGAHGCVAGDLIFISTTVIWRNNGGDNLQGEICRVMRVDGNTIYFDHALEDDYPAAVTSVKKITCGAKNVTIDGIIFRSTVYAYTGYPGGAGASKGFIGIWVTYGDGLEIANCEFNGLENRAVRWDNVIDSNINNSIFRYCTLTGAGYGVDLVYACQNVVVEDCEAYHCRHWICAGDTGGSPGVGRHIFVRHNYSEDSDYWTGSSWTVQNQYDCHVAGQDINFLYNEATGRGYGLYHHGYSGQIVGNNFHDLGLYGIGIGTPEHWVDSVGVTKYQDNVLIEGNTIDTTTSYGILLGWDIAWGEVRYTSNIVISYNTITNVANYGIRAYNTSFCLINNNELTGDGSGTGIKLEATCSDVQGSENTFSGFTPGLNIVDASGTNFDDVNGGYATIWRQSYDEVAGVPTNIYPYDFGGAATIQISDGGDYIEFTNTAANTHFGQIYGLRNQRKCRYIVDVEWTTAGTYFYIAGLKFYVYGVAPFYKFRLEYKDTLGGTVTLPDAFGYSFGADHRLTITVDVDYSAWNSDDTQGYAYITAVSAGDSYGPVVLPLEVNTTRENWFRNMFTRNVLDASPENTAIFRVYSIEQQICTPHEVLTIGSNIYQPYGYDGPHPSGTVAAGMNALTVADKGGTIFADPTYIPAFGGGGLAYLQGLIAAGTGWDLGMHFSTTVLATCVTQYYAMKATFGYAPKTWCWIGAAPTQAAAEYLFQNCEGLVNRHYLTTTIADNFCSAFAPPPPVSSVEKFQNSADSGYAGTHAYVHETDITPNIAYSLDSTEFAPWVIAVIANELRVIGYWGWYEIHSNQIDALMATSEFEGTTTVTIDTNGYRAIVLAKHDVDEITVDGAPIDFIKTEDNYVIFELEDEKDAVLGGGGGPGPEPSTGGVNSRTIFGGVIACGEPHVRPH